MIRMIIGWTVIGLGRNHSVHLIREIIVPDCGLLLNVMRGEVRVKDVCTMIRMIFGWPMIGLSCNHSVRLIREIIVPDGGLLPKLLRGEVRVKDVEGKND